jgi:hypothetical protein
MNASISGRSGVTAPEAASASVSKKAAGRSRKALRDKEEAEAVR